LFLRDLVGDVKTIKVPNIRKDTLQTLSKPLAHKDAVVVTDQHIGYYGLHEHFRDHLSVDHSKEFVRRVVHTNFAESYHSLL
jgi:hypothetical protein